VRKAPQKECGREWMLAETRESGLGEEMGVSWERVMVGQKDLMWEGEKVRRTVGSMREEMLVPEME
jgi:hypothetical protein